MDMEYISAFLSRVEGPLQTTGYIPCNLTTGGTANYRGGPNPERYEAMGASGVTIATGCDLGQTNMGTMLEYGLKRDIAKLFTPYYGRQRRKPINALRERPLQITEAQARLVDLAVHTGYMQRWVAPAFLRDAGVDLSTMPVQAQAVVMSLCFQKGVGGVRRDWPRVWGFLTRQQWRDASAELCNGFRQYATRRRTEGSLLRELG